MVEVLPLWVTFLWIMTGLFCVLLIGWYRWNRLGHNIDLFDLVVGCLMVLGGPVLFVFIAIYFLVEIVKWDMVILRGNPEKRVKERYW